jgi:AcrR family transcriptional regulator
MINEHKKRRPRPYRQKLRADRQAQTRQRITEAVVELHERVGPARTTISEIAELAGVGRMTVYKHFPTEAELFRACSAHWGARHPPPDFAACATEPDAVERARCVLARLYAYFRQTYPMMGKIARDAPLMPALQGIVDAGWTPLQRGLEALLTPPRLDAAARCRAQAAARLVLDLHCWETLTAGGLDDVAAAELAAQMYQAALAVHAPGRDRRRRRASDKAGASSGNRR